jgi:hypothetical protein
MPNFDSRHSKIAFTICYSASLVALIATTIVSSLTDPSDPIMIKYRNGSNEEYKCYDAGLNSTAKITNKSCSTATIAAASLGRSQDTVKHATGIIEFS